MNKKSTLLQSSLTVLGGIIFASVGYGFLMSNAALPIWTKNASNVIVPSPRDLALDLASSSVTLGTVTGSVVSSTGLTFTNATGSGNLGVATLAASGLSSLATITFSNATGTGNLQAATLKATGLSTLATVTLTSGTSTGVFASTGGLKISGSVSSTLSGNLISNSTSTGLVLRASDGNCYLISLGTDGAFGTSTAACN